MGVRVLAFLIVAAAASVATHAPVHAAGRRLTRQDRGLARERALLEQARTALSRGQPTVALVALGRHELQFARGQLLEECESLWVQALVAADEPAEARERAERFRARFPRSIFLLAVDHSLRAIP